MGFASVKEVIRRFSGLEDRFQATFVLFSSFLLDLSPRTMQFCEGSASGVNKWRPRIALLDVASIGGTVSGILTALREAEEL